MVMPAELLSRIRSLITELITFIPAVSPAVPDGRIRSLSEIIRLPTRTVMPDAIPQIESRGTPSAFGSRIAFLDPIMVLTHLIETVEKKSDEDGSWVPL